MKHSTKVMSLSAESQLGEAAHQYLDELQAGKNPDLEQYVRRYPEIESLIREMLPRLEMLGQALVDSLPVTNSVNKAPKQLGDFRILQEIGRGGMGVVYEAEQLSVGRTVALKVLPFAGMIDNRPLQRFRNECRAAATLDHPNIVHVYSVGEEQGIHYYAMQLIRGQSLADIIEQLRLLRNEDQTPEGSSIGQLLSSEFFSSSIGTPNPGPCSAKLPPSGALETNAQVASSTVARRSEREYYRSIALLGVDAASALHAAHEQGVVHRDIKPANLLLDAKGKLWVTDFGLARIEADVGMTMTGDIVGTLRYMSPEQALAKRAVVDNRTDIYSLGATLYEAFVLRPALQGSDRQELLRKIAFEEPCMLRKVDRSLPAELETIVHKCLAKDPEERYATAEKVADDLRNWLDDRPICARRANLKTRMARMARRHSGVAVVLAIAMSTITILLAGGFFAMAAEKKRTASELDRAEQNLLLATKIVDDICDGFARRDTEDDLHRQQDLNLMRILLRYNHDFIRLNGQRDDLRLNLAIAGARIAQLHQLMRQHVECEKACRENLQILKQLLAEDGEDDATVRRQILDVLALLANALGDQGRQPEALKVRNEHRRHLEQLIDSHPTVEYRIKLSQSHAQIGAAFRALREDQAAERELRQGVETARQLLLDAPDSEAVQLNYADCLFRLMANRRISTLDDNRLSSLMEIYHIRRRAAERHSSIDNMLGLAEAHKLLGIYYRTEGDVDAAMTAFDNALRILRELFQSNPSSVALRSGVGQFYWHRAHTLKTAGRMGAAEVDFANACRLTQEVAELSPDTQAKQFYVCLYYHDLADAYRLNGKEAESIAQHRQAMLIAESLAPIHNPLMKNALAESRNRMARSLASCRDANLRDIQQAIAYLTPTPEGYAFHHNWQWLPSYWDCAGAVYCEAGEWESAVKVLLESPAIMDPRYEAGHFAQNALYLSLCFHNLDQPSKADEWLKKAEDWMTQYSRAEVDVVELRDRLRNLRSKQRTECAVGFRSP